MQLVSFCRRGFLFIFTCFFALVTGPEALGQSNAVYQQVYSNIGGGTTVADLTNNAKYPNSPDSTAYLTTAFEAPTDVADNYGQRCRALITAPLTGSYTFWIASDDASTLFLSTDDNPNNRTPVASVAAWTASREWTKEANQQSAPQSLIAGQKYYIEALMKEGIGGDNLAVRWQLPNATIEEPIPATRLNPFTGVPTAAPSISVQPTNTSAMESTPATFVVQVANFDAPSYQWQRNSNNIPGANSYRYTIATAAATNNGDYYRCVISNSFGLAISSNAVLTVTPDTVAPTLVSAASVGYTGVQIVFSENLQPSSATNAANYTVTNSSGPLAVSSAAFSGNNRTILLTSASQTPWAVYTVTVNGVRDASSNTNVIAANQQTTFTNIAFTLGYIRRELFYGIGGNAVSDLTSSPNYPNSPSVVDYPSSMGWPVENIAESYGGRMWGYLVPPTNGTYTFAIRSDDASQLFLSTNDQATNKVSLTAETGCCNAFDAHVSAPVNLVAGQKYYIEALMKEGGGGDYLYVAWKAPWDSAVWNVIPGTYLGNYFTSTNATVTISQQPTNTTAVSGQTATFSVVASGSSSITTNLTYQWQRNAVDISGANAAIYTTPTVSQVDSGATYRVVISLPGKSVTSSNAILTVVPDTFPPTIFNVQNVGTTNVNVIYSEPVEALTATNIANYSISNGVTISRAVFGSDTRTIVLTVSALTFGSNYTLRVSNVRDRAATPNTIAPNSAFLFVATAYTPIDIGNPAQPGSLTILSSNGFNVIAGGTDIGSSSDQFQFSYQQRTGDFDVNVRLAQLGLSDLWAKAGLMAREDLTASSRFAAALTTPSVSGSFFESRDPAGALAASSGWFPANFAQTYLRLKRAGNVFSGYASYDGVSWVQLGSVTIAMPATIYFGLATSSHTASQNTAAQFRELIDVTSAILTTNLATTMEPLGPSTRRTGLVISEVMYHPAERADGRNLEFVELYNSTPMDEPLTGFRISGAIDYNFLAGTILKAGAFLVVAKVPGDIQAVYGITNVNGPFIGALQNSSGTVRLRNERDTVLLEAEYNSNPPWPIAADGGGHSLVLARPSYGERNAAAWAASADVGGSPGMGDPVPVGSLRNVLINEFLAHTDLPDVDYIELYNHSTQTNDLSGCTLSDTAGTNKFTIPNGTVLLPRRFIVFTETQLGFALSAAGEDIFFRDPSGRVIDAVRFEGQANGIATGRFPDGSDGFHELAAKTPGTTNAALLVRDIVINEIMYDPISGLDDDQYVELYNRGSTNVNLSRWRFTDGIDFYFPSNAVVPANGYLVVAKNLTNLLAHYGNLNSNNTVGEFSGSLSSKGERLALSMPDELVTTNSGGALKTNVIYIVADEVTYGVGGRWAKWAHGGGSSLELIDPRSDHRLAANWADSDETAKAPWTTIEATGLLDNGSGYNGGPIDNLQIGLTGEGECLLDNVQVFAAGGTNLIGNSTFETGLGNWFPTGTHIRSGLDTSGGDGSANCLHIRASARGDTGANRIRTPLGANLTSGQVATIRGRFRWLRGMPEVIMRVHGNWLEAVGRFSLPSNLGTPGMRNSRAVTNAGPAISGVVHTPILPAASQAVIVTARVHDFDGISSVQLKYRLDPATGFSTVIMRDDGTSGDAVAGDGVFSGIIPGQNSGTLVAFYVQATDIFSPQATTFFPNDAPTHECLVRWGESQPISSFGTYRIWLTQNNVNNWINRLVMSNDPIDGSFVYGNWRVIYNMGSHYAGSPYHQGFDSPVGGGCHYSIDLPDDDQLLGTGNFNKIHAPGNGPFDDDTIQREQTAYWMARQLGLPFNYRRYVNVFVNGNRRGTLMEDTQTPGSDVVDALYPDDNDGNLHKLQPWFEMDDATTGSMGFSNNGWCTLNKYTTTNGYHKLARYRYNFLTRAASTSENEYTNVFNLIDAANTPVGPQYTANMEALVDTEEWLRTFAIEHGVGNWDSFGNNNAQNMYGYKPKRGKWVLLIWDYNIVLGNSGSDGPSGDDLFKYNGADSILPNFINNAPFRRAYWRGYQDIINGPMRNELVDPIMDARYANFLASGINVTSPSASLKNWITTRRAYIQSQLNTVIAPFAITSNGGNDFTTNNNLLMLTGTAPVGVKTITINGVAFPPNWTTISNFTLSIPLMAGNNLLVVQGFDSYGNPLSGASDTITVNYSGANALPQDNLVFNEIMYNPAVPDASYVEIYNNSSTFTFDVSNWRIDGIDFIFPPGTIIRPNSFLVVVKDPFVFASTYGTSIPIAGTFDGSLQNNGETLKLIKPGATPDLDQIIDIVRYDDQLPWPLLPDGFGSSLQLIDPAQDNYRVANWTATPPSTNPPQHLIILTNLWKYHSAGVDLGTSWQATAFNDTSWSSGRALFWGTNTASSPSAVGPTNTYVAFTNPKQLTFYFRAHFNFAGSPAGVSLTMSNVIDDGAVFYLNGQEAFRWNMPTGTIGYSTLSSTTIATATAQGPFSFPATYLLQGDNVIAVEVHQSASTSSDMAFGMTLDSSGGSSSAYTPGAVNSVRATLAPFPLLWINEILATNNTGIMDNTGTREPWIELYNSSTNAISLSGYYLANNYTNLALWPFPTNASIASKQFLVLFADGETNQTTTNELHTNFRLSSPLGSVALSRVNLSQTSIVDYVNYFGLTANRSYGSYPDGQPQNRQIFVVPTPGATNNPATAPLPVMINEWMADNAGLDGFPDPADGLFQDWFELYNPNTNAVDLSDYTLTDNLSQPTKFTIPNGTSIGALGFLLVWADNNTNQNGFNADLHASFQLNNNGEAIGLYAPDGTPQNTVTFDKQYQNVSQGRWPDGNTNGVFYFMTNWTPRSANVLSSATNTPPTLSAIGNKSVNEGSLLRFTNSASDSDIPTQTLTFSLDPGAPAAAAVGPLSGIFTWTPSEADGPGSYPVTIRVTDNGSPPKSVFETITITVNEVNTPPVLNPIGNKSVNEGSPLNFTAIATDSDQPANSLAFSLDPGAPGGANINPTTGAFSWTPNEAQGPGSYPVTIRVTDNGSPPLNDSQTITITVNEVNSAPTLSPIGSKTVAEGTTLSFTASATDPDFPAQTLTFSLDAGAPTNTTINPSTGQFTWTPTEAQGPSTNSVTVRVTDNGSPAMNAFETISVVVNEVNSAPTLPAIADKSILEGTLLTFTNAASDSDIPAQTLTYSFATAAPAGATLNSSNGVFAWTPSETQGGTTNVLAISVTDSGSPSLSVTQTFTVIVLESNSPPTLLAITNRTVAEGSLLSFSASASDSDIPAQTLTFTLDAGAPSGAAINPTNGLFTWTPSEAQGPSTNSITVRVTDDGSPAASDAKTFTVTVTEVNSAPALDPITDRAIDEGSPVSFSANATDGDLPAQILTFSLDAGAPAGASINSSNGLFSWTPSEAQGPSTNPITIRVTDNGSPPASATRTFTIIVNEVNSPPILSPIGAQSVREGTTLSFTAHASDSDVPTQTLTFSLDAGAPAGASINASNGLFTWTPTEAQGPSTNSVTVRVTDNGSAPLNAFETITIVVTETNSAPALAPIADQSVTEGSLLAFTAVASDSDIPAQTLTFSLDAGAPAGASINSTNGVFTWTPAEDQGPATNFIVVRVTDDGVPPASSSRTVMIVVAESNRPPVLGVITNRTVAEGNLLSFTITASDSDLPAQTLTFSLDPGAPSGASINPTNGLFTWTPSEAQGPGTNSITVRVTDSGTPALSDTNTFTIVVTEVNSAPTLSPIGNKSVAEGTQLSFTATAGDTDAPPQILTFSLDSGAPTGATIDSATGQFAWTPGEADGPGTNSVTIRVTDNGSPPLSAFETIRIIVTEVNTAPTLDPIADRVIDEGSTLTFTATASDGDLPVQTLTFALDAGAPTNAVINASNGQFTWTPNETQGPSTNSVTIRVTDNGSPPASATRTFTIIVNEVNSPPALDPIADRTIGEGSQLSFAVVATDPDWPAQKLTFSLDSAAPPGASLNLTNGTFTWTPGEADGPGTNTFAIRVIDDGSPPLSATQFVTIIIEEVNQPPAIALIPPQTLNEGTTVSFFVSASDPDLPAQTLTFSLEPGAPLGASINPTNGLFSWTPGEADGPGTNVFGIRVTDSGAPPASVVQSVTIIVQEVNSPPVMDAIGNRVIMENSTLTFTVHATDSDIPTQQIAYHLAAGAPPTCSLNPTTGVFTWTPAENEGPSTNTVTIFATDNGSPNLSAAETFDIIVTEDNQPPVLVPIASRTVHQRQTVHIAASASDPDWPLQVLTYSLAPGAPGGATINSTNGVFTWSAATDPGTNIVTVLVTDDGSPVRSDSQTFSIVVVEEMHIGEVIYLPNGSVRLSWNAVPGQKYQLQSKENLDASQWSPVGDQIMATETIASATDDRPAASSRFYRVMIVVE